MARSTVKLEVELEGPLWQRKAEIREAAERATSDTADQAHAEVRSYLGRVLKNPTGAYENAIHKAKRGSFAVVGDGGATYGPWLESGRTTPGRRTRFKGYAAFRRTRTRVAKMLREAAKRATDVAVKQLGGS